MDSLTIRLDRIEATLKKLCERWEIELIKLNTAKCLAEEEAEDLQTDIKVYETQCKNWEEWFIRFPYFIPYVSPEESKVEDVAPDDFNEKIKKWLEESPFICLGVYETEETHD